MVWLNKIWLGSLRQAGILCAGLLLGACSHEAVRAPAAAVQPMVAVQEIGEPERKPSAAAEQEVEDLKTLPQSFDGLADAAGDRLHLAGACQERLLQEYLNRYFAPWRAPLPAYDPAEAARLMKQEGEATWYGPNKRRVAPGQMEELIRNCALEGFPSRNDAAISVAPAHLRALPTHLPHYQSAESYPFDMFSNPHVKLNEPLRVLHASRDGVWLFVETGYTNGWLEARDVALVDRPFIDGWMQAPHLAVVRDYAPIADGRGVATFRAKVGTLLPLVQAGDGWREVEVASAGEGGMVISRRVRIPSASAVPFPLEFTPENIAMVGNQLLGEPYGWGEIYDLRDCSALLRDFFLPFGIWLPRTSADQIASLPNRIDLARMTPAEKEVTLRRKGVPFLTLLYKPGHIMLYLGLDKDGRPLVFHDAWSIRLAGTGPQAGAKKGTKGRLKAFLTRRNARTVAARAGVGERSNIIGISAITTLAPGRELGLVTGGSLLERITELGTITARCPKPNGTGLQHRP